ncbi:MAG TPA: amidohydrolase family protein [Actinocrinis sp.]|nr:amidohydrolase family protein [Actinocrinis sp.]
MLTLHSADLVLPVSADPIPGGAVLVDGDRIAAVDTAAALREARPDARERAWGAAVLMPGLVNAHAHLQYTDFEELNSIGEPFHVWIQLMAAKRGTFTDPMWQESARRGLHMMLKSGTTAVADIVTEACVLQPTARSEIGGVSYLEILFQDAQSWSDGGRAALLAQLDGAPAGRAVGVSPHTPYTVSTAVFADAIALARERGLRSHPHIAESLAEVEFVATGTGPFVAFAESVHKSMELIRDGGSGLTVVGYLDKLGVLGPDVHGAHCVHCDGADRRILRDRGVHAALCVRSNRILQSGEPPVADYLREGSPFGIGTDSLASTPSLDLLEEAAALRDLARDQGYTEADLDRRIIAAATLGGAGAMGLADAGRLEPGARADLAVFALTGGAGSAAAIDPSGSVDPLDSTAQTDPSQTASAATTAKTASALATAANPYGALLDAAAAGEHRCLATVLGGKIVHRAA